MINLFGRRTVWDLLLILLLLLGLAACSRLSNRPSTSSPLSPLATIPTSMDSPVVTPSSLTPFRLNEPLLVGTTQVSGWGPAGLQIIIVDVTMGAEQIGATRIEANGTFEAKVPPLPEAHRIGIMSENLPTEVKSNISELWGPGAIELPMIGKVYASVMTKK